MNWELIISCLALGVILSLLALAAIGWIIIRILRWETYSSITNIVVINI